MRKRILILTELGDVHAYAVAEAVAHKGGVATIWHTADFPEISGESVLYEDGRWSSKVAGPDLEIEDFCSFDAVWYRRPVVGLSQHRLHPADREFAQRECRIFRRSLFASIAPDAFWVNPPEASARANHKILQHQAAHAVGMATPDTAYTNDPKTIRAFLARHGGKIVYKPFHGATWRNQEGSWTPYTSLLTEKALVADDLLRATPGIYQELLPKAYELRVTVLGGHVFGARILSQETETGRLDWRRSYHELRIEPCELSMEVVDGCRAVLRRLGLVFGCFDFVVTPDGRVVFLEVNEGGQFLFIERYAGTPLLDAFAEFLLQGRADFSWSEQGVTVRYSEIHEAICRLEEASSKLHLPSPDRAFLESDTEGK